MPLTVDSLPPDLRGEIHKLDLAGVKVNLLFSRKGTLRAGDWHPVRQYDMVLRGAVKITMMLDHWKSKEKKIVRCGGELAILPANVPHLFEFAEDTWMLEWWGVGEECKAIYYRPYRERVEESMRCDTPKQ